MKCIKCDSSNIIIFNRVTSKETLISVKNNYLVFQDPFVNHIYYNSRYPYEQMCLNCYDIKNYNNDISEVLSPMPSHKEITLDIDGTLIDRQYFHDENWDTIDFKIKVPDMNKTYNIKKRPYLEEFIKFCSEHFKKINIYTAAETWWMEQVLNNIEIPKNKIGYLKTGKDTEWKRPISFEREHVKKVNNSLVIDDNYKGIEGYNNLVYHIPKYFYTGSDSRNNDNELIKLKEFILTKKESKIKWSNSFKGNINLQLRKLSIPIININKKESYELIKNIKSIKDEEMKNHSSWCSDYEPYFEIDSDIIDINFRDINYENYLKIIKKYSKFICPSYKKLDKKTFKTLAEKKESFFDDF